MDMAFVLACWAICLASGYIISGSGALGAVMVAVWHISMIVMVQWFAIAPDE